MRMLRIVIAYLWSMGLFLCVIPALTIGVGHLLDGILKLRKLNFGSGMVALAGLAIGFGLFWVAWSWYSLFTVGKGHPQEAFGVSLAPNTGRLVTSGPFTYTRNPMVFGYWIALTGAGFAWRSIGASMITPLIGTILFACYLKLFEEKNLERRFGDEYVCYRQRVPLFIPRFWRKGTDQNNHDERSMMANGSSGR